MKTKDPAEGEFWLPEAPAERVPGTLFLAEEEGPRLRLLRMLAEDRDLNPIPVILGSTFGLNHVTLIDCFRSLEEGSSLLEIRRQTLLPSRVFSGAHLAEPAAAPIKRAWARFNYLDQWVSRPTTDWTGPNLKDNGEFAAEIRIDAKPLETARMAQATIHFDRRLGTSESSARLEISYECHVRWELVAPLTLDELMLGMLFPFRDLYSMALGVPAELHAFEFKPASELPAPPSGVAPVRSIEVFLLEMRHPSRSDLRKRIDFLFTIKDLSPRLDQAMTSWYQLYANHEQTLLNFFSVAYRADVYAEARFLSLIQALEAFCRREYPADVGVDPEEHVKLLEQVPKVFPAHAEWLRSKLKGNEPSLRRRLKKLVRDSPVRVGIIGSNADDLVSRVVEVRHALSHGAQLELSPTLGDFEVDDLNDALTTLIEALLLSRLGFEKEVVAQRLNRVARNRGRRVLVQANSDSG